jgi:hypothetical protein
MLSLEEELAAIEEVAISDHKILKQSKNATNDVGKTVNNVEKGSLTKTKVSAQEDTKLTKGSAVAKAKQRNSKSFNPLMPNALAGLKDLVDSDSDSEEPSSAQPAPPHAPNLQASGGPDHRPLVGGFAAAAYEAARVDYYKKKGMTVKGHRS